MMTHAAMFRTQSLPEGFIHHVEQTGQFEPVSFERVAFKVYAGARVLPAAVAIDQHRAFITHETSESDPRDPILKFNGHIISTKDVDVTQPETLPTAKEVQADPRSPRARLRVVNRQWDQFLGRPFDGTLTVLHTLHHRRISKHTR